MSGPRCRVCTGENVQYQREIVQSNLGPIHWTARTEREYDGHAISCGTDVYEDAKEEIADLRAKLARAESVLRFYADPKTYEVQHSTDPDLCDSTHCYCTASPVSMDEGDLAQSLLPADPTEEAP